jgi:hypothetical protein
VLNELLKSEVHNHNTMECDSPNLFHLPRHASVNSCKSLTGNYLEQYTYLIFKYIKEAEENENKLLMEEGNILKYLNILIAMIYLTFPR